MRRRQVQVRQDVLFRDRRPGARGRERLRFAVPRPRQEIAFCNNRKYSLQLFVNMVC